ncbi:hypothetical protein FRB97_007978 [Tulasnella sp. 331]|nr:hypothetical protein FRB97_007978 [Tulasnella sp. 331]
MAQSTNTPFSPGNSLEDGYVRISFEDLEAYAVAEQVAASQHAGGKALDVAGDAVASGRPYSIPSANNISHSDVASLIIATSALRVSTDTVLTDIVREANPGAAVIATRDYNMAIFNFPNLTITPLSKDEIHSHFFFAFPARRGQPGGLIQNIQFGAFTVKWGSETFLMYTAQFSEGFGTIQQYWFVHNEESTINKLLLAAAEYSYELYEQILLFVHGYWQKSHDLWADVQKANWDDVILDATFKKQLQRGIIFLGPPGNGKTISIKAIMKNCPHPVLVVKNFTSFAGDEMSIQLVFAEARRMAPCLMVLEDLDSLINDRNRSFFLNEMDGLSGNDGLLLIGTTNHFDKLDPALSKRPSRFDRKFEFLAPTKEERGLYMKYWQKKLKNNNKISFPDSLLEKIVSLTDGFSFAYLKEAMISTLVTLAGNPDDRFEEVVKKQIKTLRKSIDEGYEERSGDKFHRALTKPLKSCGLKMEEFCEGFDPQDPLIQKLIGALVQDVARRRMDIKHLNQPALRERFVDASTYISTGLPGSYTHARPRRHHRIRRRQEISSMEQDMGLIADWRSPSFTEEENEAADLGSSTSLNFVEAYPYAAGSASREARQMSLANRYSHDVPVDVWLPPASSSTMDVMASSYPAPYRPETARSSLSPPSPQPYRLAPPTSRRQRGSSTLLRQPSIRMRSRTVDFSEFHNRRNEGIRLAAEVEGGPQPLEDENRQPSLASFGMGATSGALDATERTNLIPSENVIWHTDIPSEHRSPSPTLEHPVSSMRSSFALASAPIHIHSSFLSPHGHPIEGYGYALPSATSPQLHRSPSPLPQSLWENADVFQDVLVDEYGLVSVPYRQDLPPSGGFEAIRYKRNLPIKGPSGIVLLAGATLFCGYGFYKVGQGNLEKRELKREKAWARIHLVPMLMAEGDRDAYRRQEAALAREKEIMKDVPGWEGFPAFIIRVLVKYTRVAFMQTSSETIADDSVKAEDLSLPRSLSEEMMQFTDYRTYERSVMEREEGLRLDLQESTSKYRGIALEDAESIFQSESTSTASDSPSCIPTTLDPSVLPSESKVDAPVPENITGHPWSQNWEQQPQMQMIPPPYLFAQPSRPHLPPMQIIYQPIPSSSPGSSCSAYPGHFFHPHSSLPGPPPFIGLYSPTSQQSIPLSPSPPRSPFHSPPPSSIHSPTLSSLMSPIQVGLPLFTASLSPSFNAAPAQIHPPPSWPTRSSPAPKTSMMTQHKLVSSTSRLTPRCDPPQKRTLRSARSITTVTTEERDEGKDVEDFTSRIALEGDSGVEVESGVETPKRRKHVTFKQSSPALSKSSGDQEGTNASLPVVPAATSVLKPKPKLPPSKWQIYFATYLRRERERKPSEKMNVANIARDAAVAYKSITAAENDGLNAQVKKGKAEYTRELKRWERTLTPEDIKNENAFRTAQRRAGQSRKSNMKDPNAPKKPMSPYFIFLQKIRESPELTQAVWGSETETTVQSKLAAAKWRSMTQEEKEPFLAQAESEKQDYTVKYKEYEHAATGPQHDDSDGSQS